MKNKLHGTVLLLFATVIWGFAFIAQSVGMDAIGPFTFQMVRCALAAAFLFPCACISDFLQGKKNIPGSWMDRRLWRSGILCGLALFAASSLQQVGLVYTDAGKAGFLTALYIVLVPILGVFLGRKLPANVVWSVLIALVGLYLLSCTGLSGIQLGDLLLMGCALAFAVQITCIDRLSGGLNGMKLNCIQALTVSILSIPFAFFTEEVIPADLIACRGPLFFAGVLSMGVAYTLQIEGQKRLEPTRASLIMSLESVFALLGGWWLLEETMTKAELSGCALVFAAVILSQLPQRKNTPVSG